MSTPIQTTTATVPTLKLRHKEFKRPDLKNYKARAGTDISSVFSSALGEQVDADVFPSEFSDLKKRIIQNPKAVQESWFRLKKALKEKIEVIEKEGSKIIPEITYEELQKLEPAKREEILEKGCVVVRGVFPRDHARKFKTDAEEYVELNPQTKGFPQDNKIVYELYWSKSQVGARSDPRMLTTMNSINHLWHADSQAEISLDHNLSYADRFRIRNPGDNLFALGPHADGGGIERWEDDEYRECYKEIWDGNWENYDPFDATHRAKAQMTKYPTAGACSVFRSFQGWVSMSDAAPGEGTIQFAPFIKEVSAYFLLRPFFNENDELDLESTKFPGTVLGKNQEFNDLSHPDLNLSKLMTSIPKVQPGDAVFWHCDMIHAVDSVHNGKTDSSVMYIPTVPLCDINIKYLQLQREAFLNGFPGPDFPGFPAGLGETTHKNRADSEFVHNVGGAQALRELGLEPFEYNEKHSAGTKKVIDNFNQSLFQM